MDDGLQASWEQDALVQRMDDMLHGLCQPLTVLQCRLALGQMDGGAEAMREALAAGLTECTRLTQSVVAMREMLTDSVAAIE